MKDGSADVKKHRWFREMKWDDVLDRKLKVKTVLMSSYSVELFNRYTVKSKPFH